MDRSEKKVYIIFHDWYGFEKKMIFGKYKNVHTRIALTCYPPLTVITEKEELNMPKIEYKHFEFAGIIKETSRTIWLSYSEEY